MAAIAKIICLLLPALVCAKLEVKIDVSQDERQANAMAFGEQMGIISDREREAFHVNDQDLKHAVEKFQNRWPNDVFVHSPTYWNDLYKRYKWDQVRTTLRPVSARVLGVQTTPVIIATKDFENRSSHPSTCSGEISQEISNSYSTTTSKGGDITVGQEVEYSVAFPVGSAGGKTSFSFSNNWGESTTKTETTTLKSSVATSVMLKPGQSSKAVLSANKGTMEVEVEYEATLTGYVATNFEHVHKGHHFWAYDVNDLLEAAGHPKKIMSKEIIKIGFYSDEKVTLYDGKGLKISRDAILSQVLVKVPKN